ncbi:3-oxoacyl-ACP reductase FabG [Nocardia seriolae]|uniref:3-oxoacyl-ACP synthase n=1 Tax=Nocardia seriolae TaxID=37332 RepID=A0ABC8AV51_9NOCA|nr:3-oxoacyl-[acyl-carrier-protein] reductase [Nocardia seriolae]GEM26409.1 3-oxoacyl-[acyl-carrier-protein] reductase [Nocardia seriolae NBRC 15557]OJF80047.1 3-oxoacyl-[acyl-carrier-protein] reductase [Nocardia seriolae]BAW06260.1 3-oxoacyl-ACP synthase [Nocardia seriolae]BEK87590.1 3-oxoacyl-ACP reductase FabG [Nocardia seriolae]
MGGLVGGRTAVVTGAAQGIGLEIARVLLAHGAKVVVADLDPDRVKRAVEELSAAGPVVGAPGDVTAEADVESFVDLAVREFGGLDIYVNNAGITRDASLRNLRPEDFDAVIAVHLKGTWLGVRAASAVMRAAGRGSIVNMSSLSGKSGNPGQTNYSAAKAGIVGLTKASAKELAHKGVRVNAIQPGLIRTPMTEAMKPEVFAAREADIPMRRAGEPAEVADVALFLALDLSSYMTGAVLEVGGGRLM